MIGASFLMSIMAPYAAYYGLIIVRKWDLTRGSELQIELEKRTYLISTLLTYILGFQLISLFLYVYTADNLKNMFVGAMCAAGTLSVNRYGFPALIVKMFTFILCSLWIILNYVDMKGYDYPLIKKKYILLISITPFILADTVLQFLYFINLKADVITSCCGTLFRPDSKNIVSDMTSFPTSAMKTVFYTVMFLTILSGLYYYKRERGGYFFSTAVFLTFIISIGSIISFISLYYYEIPTHHCPFCILKEEYGYIGYPIYFTLFGGAVSGIGAGMLTPFRRYKSLEVDLPIIQSRLTFISIFLYSLFTIIVTYRIIFSDFIHDGY